MSDSDTSQFIKTPWHLWVVGILAILWNSVGVMDFMMTMTKNDAYMSSFSEAQREFFYSFPLWIDLLWGIAVFGGVIASLLLLLRQKPACRFFVVSLLSLTLTTLHNYLFANALEVAGDLGSILFSVVIFIIALLLVVYSRSMHKRGILG